MSGETHTPRCVKCGSTDIRTFWHRAYDYREACGYYDAAKSREEHLHHYCQGCHFDWITPTLDREVRDVG